LSKLKNGVMFQSIIVPIDIAELDIARFALRTAVNLADKNEVKLVLLHVVPIVPSIALDAMPVGIESEIAEKAKETLMELGKSIDLPHGAVLVDVRVGGLYYEVLSVAQEQRADLIIVGSHQPGLATYLFGSDAGGIVTHAQCSVMVLRQQDHDDEALLGDEAPAASPPSMASDPLL
jgi:nucleotide-binding universal stress UspA family protein